MESIPVAKLKAEFSAILHRIEENGEMFTIEYGRSHKKIAMLIPYQPSLELKNPRIFGIMKNRGAFSIGPDFEMTDNELLGDD